MSHRCLLLNAYYMPHAILPWERAITMLYEETADVVVEYSESVSSPSVTWKLPAVMKLRRATARNKKGVKFSRLGVYLRDGFACGYCGNKFPMRALTFDHVVPRKLGGATDWGNILTACKSCNAIKADMTCDQSGMYPRKQPHRPKSLPMHGPVIDAERAPEEWLPFLPGAIVE